MGRHPWQRLLDLLLFRRREQLRGTLIPRTGRPTGLKVDRLVDPCIMLITLQCVCVHHGSQPYRNMLLDGKLRLESMPRAKL
jgi:hypothetical protein